MKSEVEQISDKKLVLTCECGIEHTIKLDREGNLDLKSRYEKKPDKQDEVLEVKQDEKPKERLSIFSHE